MARRSKTLPTPQDHQMIRVGPNLEDTDRLLPSLFGGQVWPLSGFALRNTFLFFLSKIVHFLIEIDRDRMTA